MPQQTIDGSAVIATCRRACAEKHMVRYQKQAIDLFTASAIIAVYAALNTDNQAKLRVLVEKRGIVVLASLCFKLVK